MRNVIRVTFFFTLKVNSPMPKYTLTLGKIVSWDTICYNQHDLHKEIYTYSGKSEFTEIFQYSLLYFLSKNEYH